MELLKKLCSLGGASGDELAVKKFLLNHIKTNQKNWKVQPAIIQGAGFQDCLILIFGRPKAAVFAHMDVVGFTAGYQRSLIKIGGPALVDGTKLTGKDSKGKINCEMMVIDKEDGTRKIEYIFDREIDRGTNLTYKQFWKENDKYVQSCYLDNRLGIWNALKLAETLTNGAICFSCFEEHGGGTAGYLARYLYDEYNVTSALISDITWVTEGIEHGKGVALSMRDGSLPPRRFVDQIIEWAKESKIPFQLEVENAGGSDGTAIQKSDAPVDWMFIGAPESNVHTPYETVHKKDILSMVKMYQYLMKKFHA
ncbi:MAG TPA: aminopeptidase [Flavobacteriales bacterium]|nr:aminopeptidase [Flavobacteriales bacterium]